MINIIVYDCINERNFYKTLKSVNSQNISNVKIILINTTNFSYIKNNNKILAEFISIKVNEVLTHHIAMVKEINNQIKELNEDFVVLLREGDIISNKSLANLIHIYLRHKDLNVAQFSFHRIINKDNKIIGMHNPTVEQTIHNKNHFYELNEILRRNVLLSMSGSLVPTRIFKYIGYFEEYLYSTFEWEFCIRLKFYNIITFVNGHSLIYHNYSISKNKVRFKDLNNIEKASFLTFLIKYKQNYIENNRNKIIINNTINSLKRSWIIPRRLINLIDESKYLLKNRSELKNYLIKVRLSYPLSEYISFSDNYIKKFLLKYHQYDYIRSLFVNNKFKIIVIVNYKCGSTTLHHYMNFLTKSNTTRWQSHYKITNDSLINGSIEKFKLAILVRNPFSRVVSQFFHIFFERKLETSFGLEVFYHYYKNDIHKYTELTFEMYIKYITSNNLIINPHYQKQYIVNTKLVKVIKLESFKNDFSNYLKSVNPILNTKLNEIEIIKKNKLMIENNKHFKYELPLYDKTIREILDLNDKRYYIDYKLFFNDDIRKKLEFYYDKELEVYSYKFPY